MIMIGRGSRESVRIDASQENGEVVATEDRSLLVNVDCDASWIECNNAAGKAARHRPIALAWVLR
jgi:hypothetical protein